MCALLKFRVLTMLFVIPISLSSISSTSAWSLQPRLPPILTSPMSSLELVTTRSSIASPQVGVLITWLKKLSSMYSRNLLDCLQLAVLLFQQMSGWLKFPSRTRACERKAPWSGGRTLRLSAPLDLVAYSRHQPLGSLCCLSL